MSLRRSSLWSRAALVAVASAVPFASGCATKPTMRLNHAEVSGVQVGFPPSLGVVMTLFVDVNNTNSYDVAVRAMRGVVVIAERYPVQIDFRPPGDGVWLAANSTTQVRVPLTVPVDLAMTLLREAMQTPTIPFRVTGRADVTASHTFKIEKDDYEVDERGEVSRQQIEAAVRGVFWR